MQYWAGGFVQDLLIIIALIAAAAGLRRLIGPLRRLGMPDALVAGALGVVFGPTVFGLLPFDPENLEFVIYHTLALVFIAVSLQSPPPGERSGATRSLIFAIPLIATLQAIIGVCCVLAWNGFAGGPSLHTGFGVMLPLGFNQGPGQAMAFGANWEANAGMDDGAQIGLIVAVLGYAWCCVIGVTLVGLGRRWGWARTPGRDERGPGAEAGEPSCERPPARTAVAGGLEPLTTQVVAIAITYLLTWIVIALLPEAVQQRAAPFHFMIATVLALGVRAVAAKLPEGGPLDDDLLARSSSVLVDVATCAALSAVSVAVLGTYLVPVLLITTLGGLATTLFCVWMARRAFPKRPFEHLILTFGALTGTATTGLALLRMIDPQLTGPAARNYVLAVPLASALAFPLILAIPYPVTGFPADFPGSALFFVGGLTLYVIVVAVAWRLLSPMRFGTKPWKIWADE